jgi:enoyl-CoA hydratase
MGAVNRVVPADAVLDQGLRLAKQIAAAAAPAVCASKRAINRSYDIMGMRQALLAALETATVPSSPGQGHAMPWRCLARSSRSLVRSAIRYRISAASLDSDRLAAS